MEISCSRYDAKWTGAADRGPAPKILSLPMPQLPTELFSVIFRWALPPVDFMMYPTAFLLLGHMRTVYAMRGVAKRWQQIINGTPAFWTYIISTVPPHVNQETILRSANGPLTIVYTYTTAPKAYDPVPPEDFLLSLAHTFHRWSEYSGPAVVGYLDKPAPHLRKISLRPEISRIEPFELLGGNTANLRHVDLYNVPIQWKIGMFTQLTVLKLKMIGIPRLATTHLLDTLHASPGLEHLELGSLSATNDLPPSSQLITLPSLRCLRFHDCDGGLTGFILCQIRAPSCTDFCLDVYLDDDEDELRRLLNEDLQPFHGLLRAIHNRNGSSEIKLHMDEFEWNIVEDFEEHPTFSIAISCDIVIPCMDWVDRILQHDPGLSIHVNLYASVLLPQEMLERIAPMRCVTGWKIENPSSEVELSFLLEFIGKPLRASPSLPSLPCLRELLLPRKKWNAQILLDMLHSRFNSGSWKSIEWTPLIISIPRGSSWSWGLQKPSLDLTTLIRVREAHGVERVRFVGPEGCDGMLAIAWDEEASEPVWG